MAKSSRSRLAVATSVVTVTVAAVGVGVWYDGQRQAPTSSDSDTIIANALESRAPDTLEVPRPEGNEPMFVTFLGDSLTNSWGASTFEQGYRPLLTNEWAKDGRIDPVVTAVSGANLGEVSAVANIPAVTDLAIIELGTNDNGNEKTDPAVFRMQYSALVDRVRSTAPDAALLCLGTWRSQADGTELDSIIAGECDGENAKYVTLRDLYNNSDNRGPEGRPIYLGDGRGDTFHPNDAGYAAIKERIADNVTLTSSDSGTAG